MPTNWCVLLCTKKDKWDKETGEKISFFRFPEEENLKKQWIHAIRRDVGPKFSINQGTRVCSKHFRGEDLQRSLSGKVSPRTGAVPSKFAWKRSSPRKPAPRFRATTVGLILWCTISAKKQTCNSTSNFTVVNIGLYSQHRTLLLSTTDFTVVNIELLTQHPTLQLSTADHWLNIGL